MAEIDPTLIHLDAELARLERQLRREPTPDAAAAPLPAGVTEASRLAALAAAFALTPFEMDLLLLALAPAIDARFGRRFGELLDDPTQRRPTVGLALALLGVTGVARLQRLLHVGEQAPLLRFRLLELEGEPGAPSTPLVDRALVPDPTVTAWLLGSYQPPAALGPQVDLSVPDDDPADAALGAAVWPQLAAAMHGQSLTCFFGQDEESQTATARRIATGMQSPLLTVDLRAAARSGTPPATAVRLALRDARLTGAIAYLTGMDLCLNEKTILPEVQTALFAHGDVVITGGKTAWQPAGEDERRTILWQEFPLPSYAQRADLWRHFLAAQGAGQDGDAAINPAELAGLFRFTSGQIRDAVLAARDRAQARGADSQLRRDDVLAAARAYSGSKLGELAQRIVPRHHWEDLVLRPDQIAGLQEVLAMVRRRSQVLDAWGVGKKLSAGAAVTMLFAGEPGTGKTMAAGVLAGELGLDLYKIDLSALVSKYIGETEKNLEQIFVEAEQGNAILFFDEADALFGKRTGVKDAHDRYANIGVSYLLQRMESYDGVTILATNLRSNLDDAFLRRLHAVIDFPFPDETERLRLWQTLFPTDLPHAPDINFAALAKRHQLSGGAIRNAIVQAAFLAAEQGQPVGMPHLLHSLRREYQKMGRLMHDGELNLPPPTPAPVPTRTTRPSRYQRMRPR